jgi:hypothetical protein
MAWKLGIGMKMAINLPPAFASGWPFSQMIVGKSPNRERQEVHRDHSKDQGEPNRKDKDSEKLQ